MDRAQNGEAGFTLIEVLCAAMIAAVSIAGLYAGLGSSVRATDRLDHHLGARIVAQSVLSEVSREPRLIPNNKQGTAGDYTWNLRVERASSGLANIRPQGFTLYNLKLAVTWAPNGRIEVEAVRLAQ